MTKLRLNYVALAVAAALLSGCSGSNPGVAQAKHIVAGKPQSLPSVAAPRLVVFGVDRTEQFDRMTRPALALAEEALRQAAPGDELIFRWISDRSYRSDEVFAHVKLSQIPSKTPNPFDSREKALAQAAKNQVRAEAQKGLQAIRAQHPVGGTSSTDIHGFITAAAEQFSRAPSAVRKVLVIASDMEDNRRYNIRPNLAGVDVQIYLLVIKKEPDPAYFAELKARWTKYFIEKCGAARLEFVPIDRASA